MNGWRKREKRKKERILNTGAENLISPLAKLFELIYSEKIIPEQWKTAKLIPLYKKGVK